MKVLIIEDDAAIAKLYQVAIVAKGFEVEIAVDGEEGLAKVKRWMPNLILIDVMMPKMNGIDTLKAIKADSEVKDLKCVMLTNFGQEALVKEAFEAGAEDYILKYQSTPAEVAEKVNQHLSPGNVKLPEN